MGEKRTFFTDIWRKVISLFLAVVIVVWIHKKLEVHREITGVPVKFVNLNPRYKLLKDTLPVTLKIRCSSSDLNSSDFALEVDMSKFIRENDKRDAEFMQKVVVDSKNVKKKPFLVNIDGIEPHFLQVPLDVIISKYMPIEVPEQGTLKSGVTAFKKMTPDKVLVTGPSAKLKELTRIETSPLNVTELKGDVQMTLPLFSPGKDLVVPLTEVFVDVRLVRSSESEEKIFQEVPIKILSAVEDRYVWDSAKAMAPLLATVKVMGTHEVMNTYSTVKPIAYVSISEANAPGPFEAKVHIANFPEHLVTLDIQPVSLVLTLEEKKAKAH